MEFRVNYFGRSGKVLDPDSGLAFGDIKPTL